MIERQYQLDPACGETFYNHADYWHSTGSILSS